jgi:murein DD-endopeptidase
VGDGEIVVAKNGGAAGNYVAIRHGRQYMTRYMHTQSRRLYAAQCVRLPGSDGAD